MRRLHVPGDKSISHRALLFAALARGRSPITGLLDAEDVGRTRQAIRQLGAIVDEAGVTGAPWHDAGAVDCGNSGTTARLLLGALAPRAAAHLHGDASLSRRPMERVMKPLRAMGARFAGERTLPLGVIPGPLRGTTWTAEVASAQVKSAVLLAGLGAEGATTYVEPVATRDHTERMLAAMGARIDGLRIEPGPLQARPIEVPGDISSAAFWMVAAAITGEAVEVLDVGLNPTRTGVIDVLRRMGATVDVEEREGVEPIGAVRVHADGLRGVEIGGDEIPRLIDELPVLAVAAAFATGETRIRDAAELRVKESDRIAAVVAGLRAIGADADETPDGMVIRGGGARGGEVEARGDHRIAMAFLIAGLRVPVAVPDVSSIATSYPGFLRERAAWGR